MLIGFSSCAANSTGGFLSASGADNVGIFDFELSSEDMEKIRLLDRNEKHDWY